MKKADLLADYFYLIVLNTTLCCQLECYNGSYMSNKVKRLFRKLQPTNYKLHIKPAREKATFSGEIIISAKKSGRPSKRITLHQKGLTITSASIRHFDKKGTVTTVIVDRINTHNSFDEVRMHTETMLYPGVYEIHVCFEGNITPAMNGMYPCNFKIDGQKKVLIATQFESHHAREVFPCIDEPEAKATFDLTLTTPKDETVIANTPIASQATKGLFVTTTFETTPLMSTYLLAFVYGELSYKEAKTSDNTLVRAYATPDNVQFTDFALEVAVKCLDFYNNYFGIPYPLEKCDMIALPDFSSGAMENWGLITYREQCMLVDPKNTSVSTKQYVAMVVAHELAHQWFGNLVTMRWWTDLWLNEGFASWIEYMAVDHIFPEWQMWTQFSVDEQHRAFKLDALEHTHPVEVPIKHPDEIRSIFDTISYSKGASVIHMLHAYLGADDFRNGLQHYLAQNAYKNTATIDLWQALETVSKKPVRSFMHAWTAFDGFPVVNISANGEKIHIKQQRFYINPTVKKKDKTIWPIALQSNEPNIPLVLDTSEIKLSISKLNKLKLNKNQTGFYRVSYDSKLTAQLAKQIRNNDLGPVDRLGILSDVFENAKAGVGSTVDALVLLDAYDNEDNSSVWDVIAANIGTVRAVMDNEDLRNDMKPYIIELTRLQLNRLGWQPKSSDSYFDQLLRPTVLGMSAVAEESATVKQALKFFDTMKKPENINPDLRSIVYGTAVRSYNNVKTFDKLLSMHETSKLSEERTALAAALTSFKDSTLHTKALSLITTESVRRQDISYWVVYGFMNRFGRLTTWEWMKEHWKWLEDNLGNDLSFYRFPLYAANAFSDQSFIKEYTEFFNKHTSAANERSIRQGLETLQWQSAWRERDLELVKQFFSSRNI